MSNPSSNPEIKLQREQVRSWAREAGFTEAGLLALPYENQARDAARFADWVSAGRAATMDYLTRVKPGPDGENEELIRARVAVPFPWARSAIVCFANYNSAQPLSTSPAAAEAGWIARYAWSSRVDTSGVRRPSDYHKVLLKRLKALEAKLHQQAGEFEARAYVDTGPVVERALATAAGLGWTGKNTCLIHPKLGSYGFLAVLLTSLDAEKQPLAAPSGAPSIRLSSGEWVGSHSPQSAPEPIPDRCGTCRRCLDACPTNALFAPYHMDATRCISYLTIEHRGPIEAEWMQGIGRQLFGCDICQDVCPWNRKSPIGADPEFEPRAELVNPSLDWLAALDEPAFERHFNGSPIRRAGFLGLRRNVAIAMGNSGLARYASKLQEWAEAADEGLRTAARWAVEKLRGRIASG